MRNLRILASMLTAFVMISLSTIPGAFAAPGGNSDNARLCQKGGWQSQARAESPNIAFVNQGDCVSYGAQGGEIVPVFVGPYISIAGGLTGYDGVISGTGFTPNMQIDRIMLSFYPYSSWDIRPNPEIKTDANGNFNSEAEFLFCSEQGSTPLTIFVEDTQGIEAIREFAPEC